MDTGKSFEILIRKKIPFWSELLFGIMATCFIFLVLLYLVMSPSANSSGEIKVAYYILVVPEWLKEASAYSFIGLILLIPLYNVSKSRELATLTINNNDLTISGKKGRILSTESIRKIILNDVKYYLRTNKKATEIMIKQTRDRTTSFLLKDYEQTGELIEALSEFENIEFSFYNELAIESHDED